MSRRISFLVLATSAALIATQASADPECFGDTCHLPEAVEPPAAAVQEPDVSEPAAAESSTPAPQAEATMPRPAAVKVLPQVVAVPLEEEPQPMARRPLLQAPVAAGEASAPIKPARLAPRPLKETPPPARVATAISPAPAEAVSPVLVETVSPAPIQAVAPAPVREVAKAPPTYARSAQVTSPEPSYFGGYNLAPVGGVVVVAPGIVYGTARYMIAPSAKIISIDSAD